MLSRLISRPADPLGRKGVVALEFAIVAPVLVLMLVGTYDTARALYVLQQTTLAANMVAFSAQVLINESVSGSSVANLSTTQAVQAETAIYAVMPWLRNTSYNAQYSVTLSAVQFTVTGSGATATYTPAVAWSVPLTPTGITSVDLPETGNSPATAPSATVLVTNTRACGTPTVVATSPGSSATLSEIPTQSITTPGTLVIADVSYTYYPLFGKFFVPSGFTFWATGFEPPLSGAQQQQLTYDEADYQSTGTTPTYVCSGYQ
jgi:Flp pilus assembly protein TadG